MTEKEKELGADATAGDADGQAVPTDSATARRSVEWGLANVYTLARRRLHAKTLAESEREWWQHVVRIAEECGVRQPGVLRHSVPTEITEGSPIEQLGKILQQAGATVKIGLRQQGKFGKVQEMYRAGESWQAIGKAIGWSADAARDWYLAESLAEAADGNQPSTAEPAVSTVGAQGKDHTPTSVTGGRR